MKKKTKPEEYFIQKGKCFFTGRISEFNEAPVFTLNIENAKAFSSVKNALDEMKTWAKGQSLYCTIYVRTKQ